MGGKGREKIGLIDQLAHLSPGVAAMTGKVTQVTQKKWIEKYGVNFLTELLVAFYNHTAHVPMEFDNLSQSIAFFLKRESGRKK